MFADGPAQRAGLAPGDVLVAIDGLRATAANVDALLRRRADLDTVPVHAFRNGLLIEGVLPVAPSAPDTAVLVDRGRGGPRALAGVGARRRFGGRARRCGRGRVGRVGRRLMGTPDASGIARALADAGHADVAVHGFDELASTNAWLVERTATDEAGGGTVGGPGPALCVADSQVRGSGRRGRGWRSVPGDVTFSLRRRFASPPARLAPLGLVTGVAVARALRAATGLDVRLKWPNDLLLDGSKLGGLLVESRSGAGRGAGTGAGAAGAGCSVVGGVGVNLVGADARGAGGPGGPGGSGGAPIATLGAHGVVPGRRDALVVAIAASVLDAWARFDEEGWAVFEDDWRALDALAGRAVRVHEGAPRVDGAGSDGAGSDGDGGGAHFDGVARGVDGGGALRVERADGRVATVHAGDVSVRPRA